MSYDEAREAAARAADDYFSGADRAYGEHVKCANAAIDAFLAALKADGYKLVRRKATEEMVEAGILSGSWENGEFNVSDATVELGWSAMWDAAPEAGQ